LLNNSAANEFLSDVAVQFLISWLSTGVFGVSHKRAKKSLKTSI